MGELIRCANCTAPLHPEPNASSATCRYCGFETRLSPGDAPSSGAATPAPGSHPRTAEMIGLATPSGVVIPLVAADTELPKAHTETLSTSNDDQDTLHVTLVAGVAATAEGNRELARIDFPIATKGPRGTVQIQMAIEVDIHGGVVVALAERGTDNGLRRDGMQVGVG